MYPLQYGRKQTTAMTIASAEGVFNRYAPIEAEW